MSTNCKITAFRILKVDCDIAEFAPNSEFSIKVEDKLSCRKPLDPTNVSGLLEIETTITAEGNVDFKIFLFSRAFFSFSEMPEKFEETLQEECYPIAREKIHESIATITEAMGLSPLVLS